MRFQGVALVVVGLLASSGCKRWENKMEAGRQALIDSAKSSSGRRSPRSAG